MSQSSWLKRRSFAALLAMLILCASAIVLSGCGLFGADDESPQVVAPPASTTATSLEAESDATEALAEESAAEQGSQPAEVVAVTTSPSDESGEQDGVGASERSTPTSDGTIYVVQAGDTLAAIANRLGVRVDDLITLNGIQNPDVLQVGQELRVPGAPAGQVAQTAQVRDEPQAVSRSEAEQESDESETADAEQIEPPVVELPTVAVPAATPTVVSYQRFPQPGPEQTSDTIPDPPVNFLQYGAAALPWLHGINEIESLIELFKAWPMPPLAVGGDRIILVDTNEDGAFATSIVFTNPNSFGAAVPYSNLVVYDPVPGAGSKYRIGYDHAQAYGREVQGLQQLADVDVSGDGWRDLTFREITCDASGCVSSFYVLSAVGDGYRTITGPTARVAGVSSIAIEDRSGDGIADVVVEGLATDEPVAARYRFVFIADGDELVESLRIALGGDGSEEETRSEEAEEGVAEEDLLEE